MRIVDLKWSNNDGTKGWTCISGRMNPDQMRELLEWCPKGNFTPCFYSAMYTNETRVVIDTPEMAERYLKQPAYFYFNFPNDRHGHRLLHMVLGLIRPHDEDQQENGTLYSNGLRGNYWLRRVS